MACRDIAKRRKNDLARYHRRVAARREAELCIRCGKVPPAPGRTLCVSCNDKQNRASRARDARLRAEGKPRRDPAKAKLYESERRRRVYAERVAARSAPSVAGSRRGRIERPASPAPRSLARATAPVTPGPGPRDSLTGAGTPRPSESPAGRAAAAEPKPARLPACASAADTTRPKRAGRCASRAGTVAAKPRAPAIVSAAPPASA